MLNQFVTIKGQEISLGRCTGIDNANGIIWIQNFAGIETAHSFTGHTKVLRVSYKAEIEKADTPEAKRCKELIDSGLSPNDAVYMAMSEFGGFESTESVVSDSFDTPNESEPTQEDYEEWEEWEETEAPEEKEEEEAPEEKEEYSEAYIDYLCNRWEEAHEQHLMELHF